MPGGMEVAKSQKMRSEVGSRKYEVGSMMQEEGV